MYFSDWGEQYICFVFSNVMVLKAMHDRGYNVKGISPYDEVIFSSCLNAIFRGVEFEDYAPNYDRDYAESLGDEKESEQRQVYEEFCSRDHCKIIIPIPEVAELWPLTKEELARAGAVLEKFVFDPEEFFTEGYLPDFVIYRSEWLKDGLCLYACDSSEYSEEPAESPEILHILELLDLLRQFKAERREKAA